MYMQISVWNKKKKKIRNLILKTMVTYIYTKIIKMYTLSIWVTNSHFPYKAVFSECERTTSQHIEHCTVILSCPLLRNINHCVLILSSSLSRSTKIDSSEYQLMEIMLRIHIITENWNYCTCSFVPPFAICIHSTI